MAKEIGADKEKAWDRVEAIYDWVREKVKYKNGPLKGALAALKDGTGDCEELSSLFIAICRAADIPARTVWVPGHCYPEFYLVDDKGAGHWFPCQSAGSREFGGITEIRPILQKGDNFRPPKGGQGTPALHGRVAHRHAHARRREAASAVYPRDGGEVGMRDRADEGWSSYLSSHHPLSLILRPHFSVLHCLSGAKKAAAFFVWEKRGGRRLKLPADWDWMRRCETSEGQACFCTSREVDLG